jgi:hypothetical protein
MSETRIDNLVIEISADSSAASSNIDKVSKSLKGLNSAASGTKNTSKLLKSLSSAIKSFSVTQALRKAIADVNSYVENVNLFTVSMGKYADEAMSYAKKVENAMGVDISEFIRNQAIFKNMADGFGVAEEQAYKLSKGLTELAYDMSSFYNVNMEEVFQRLQSGVAGEIEPVRRWGIALDQASMKQWMLQKGIEANISTMNQADKAMVRYNMIVETMANKGAIGDLARTIQTPANAIRILNQQVTQLSRAFGTLLIPILIKVIPYIQAFVKAVTNAAQAIARLLGIDLDFNVDYSGITSGIGGMGDAMDDAAKSAKKLKDYTMGFDELNIINPDTGSGAGQQIGGAGLGLEALSVWDDSIFDGINSRVDELAGKMKWLVGLVTAVGVAFAGWKISSWIASELKAIKGALTAIAGTKGVSNVLSFFGKHKLGITLAALAITAVALALVDLWENSETFRNTVTGVLDEIKAAFGRLKDAVWNDMINPLLEAFGITAGSFSELYSQYVRPVVEKIASALVIGLGGAVVGVLDLFTLAVSTIGTAIGNIAQFIANFATNAVENIATMKDQFRMLWEQIKRNTVTKATELKNQLGDIWDKVVYGFDKLKEGIRSRIDSIKGFFGDLISKINEAIRAIEDFLTIDIGNTSIGIDLPEIGSGDKLGLKVEKYATGGVLEDGLFTMNHGEIAGKFSNGQSVVANNQQIVDGIADGVYRAMMMAQQGEESSKPLQVNVYLDGKQISKSVDKYNNSRGVSIMGNSLGYNF